MRRRSVHGNEKTTGETTGVRGNRRSVRDGDGGVATVVTIAGALDVDRRRITVEPRRQHSLAIELHVDLCALAGEAQREVATESDLEACGGTGSDHIRTAILIRPCDRSRGEHEHAATTGKRGD